MNHCTLDNGNSKANKYDLNIKHVGSLTRLVYFLG